MFLAHREHRARPARAADRGRQRSQAHRPGRQILEARRNLEGATERRHENRRQIARRDQSRACVLGNLNSFFNLRENASFKKLPPRAVNLCARSWLRNFVSTAKFPMLRKSIIHGRPGLVTAFGTPQHQSGGPTMPAKVRAKAKREAVAKTFGNIDVDSYNL